MMISVTYSAGAMGFDFDDQIDEALRGTCARRLSSGCALFGDAERDIQYSVPAKHLSGAKARLASLSKQHPKAKLEVLS